MNRTYETKSYNFPIVYKNVKFLVTYHPDLDNTFFEDSAWEITLNDDYVWGVDGDGLLESERQEIITYVRGYINGNINSKELSISL